MALPERQVVDLEGGRISYRQAGSGPDLVLLHGLAGNARTWEAQFAAFAGAHRVTAWDAPGYGESDLAEAHADAYVDRLAAFVEALDLRSFVLLGHSMGGIVAGRFAARVPDRLRGLILSCTLLGRAQAPGTPLAEGYRARLADLETLPAAEYGARRARSMAAPDCDPAILARLAGIAAETRRDGLEAAMRVIAEADNADALSRVRVPVLAVTGALDRTATRDLTDAVVAALSDGGNAPDTAEIPGAGHAPYLEDAVAYNAALSGFLSRL